MFLVLNEIEISKSKGYDLWLNSIKPMLPKCGLNT